MNFRNLLILFFLLLLPSCAFGISVQLGMGYRQSNLLFNVGGPSGVPNIISEVEWKRLQSVDILGRIESGVGSLLYGFFSFDFGVIHGGKIRDSDYRFDNYEYEMARGTAHGCNGALAEIEAGFGPAYSCCNDRFVFRPLIGLALHSQLVDKGRNAVLRFYLKNKTFFDKVEFGDDACDNILGSAWLNGWVGIDYLLQVRTHLTLRCAHHVYLGLERSALVWGNEEMPTIFLSSFSWGTMHSIAAECPIRHGWSFSAGVKTISLRGFPGWQHYYGLVPWDIFFPEEENRRDHIMRPWTRGVPILFGFFTPLNKLVWNSLLLQISVKKTF